MKKILLIFSIIIIFLLSIFIFCKEDKRNIEENINFIKNLNSYTCDVDIQVKNDRQTIIYKGKQFYLKNLGYRFELNDSRIFIYKNNKIYVNDLKNKIKYVTDSNFDNTYQLSFIGNYINLLYSNKQIKNSFKNINNIEYQIISLIIPETNRNIHKANMYINTNDGLPEYLIIYDINNYEKIRIIYKNFLPNEKINKELFNN